MSINNSNGVTADTGLVQSGSDFGSVKTEEIALIVRQSQGTDNLNSYNIYSLQEETGGGPLFNLSKAQVTTVPQILLDEFLNEEVPEYLRSGPSRHVHVVVSTGSGTGLALKFYNSVLRPLLNDLGIHALDSSADLVEQSKSNNYNLVITQHANSVCDFAESLEGSSEDAIQHTILLLGGDGGVVDLLNARASVKKPATEFNLPLVAILPLGTGNAHFHSRHRLASRVTTSIAPSSLVQSLRTLFRGKPAPLPSFKAEFPPGSRIITVESSDKGLESHDNAISHLYGGIVASYGFHSQLVWESDTPEYRKFGAERFKMVGQQLLKESHAYNAVVELSSGDESQLRKLERDQHAYILVAMLSNMEKTFTISPASKPLDSELRLVHFGVVSGQKTMEIMMQAYNEGKHIGMKWTNDDGKEEGVGYDEARVVKITTLEEDPRWRKVCIDGTIVELPQGGSMIVKTEKNLHLRILVDRFVV
ncbi:ATP-NAD kinase-like domain-containing protein [Annulohypoxylon moriforme]|nr:ATP-NAD kinase-like domain-containing protein [Annulohypoxylon moriforme]